LPRIVSCVPFLDLEVENMRLSVSIKTLTLAALVGIAAGHCVIIAATGDLGGHGTALGYDPKVLRNHTRREEKMDATRFIGRQKDQCGMTLETQDKGQPGINITAATSLVIQQSGGLPKVSESGTLNMTLHQINQDGAGPFTCSLDMTGTGMNFSSSIKVLTDIPGVDGRNKKKIIDWPFVVELPSDLKCTGSSGNLTGICLVKCWNKTGPWGGCIPIQQVQDCDGP